jgi:N-methylhydantoinase A/oxoprolinase/acetone carboxylase beta subunit
MPSAYFKKNPRRIEELSGPRPIEAAVEYKIEKSVLLSKTDFENFVTDMLIERGFLEKNAGLCAVGPDGVWHCLEIRRESDKDAILVMLSSGGRVAYAALK